MQGENTPLLKIDLFFFVFVFQSSNLLSLFFLDVAQTLTSVKLEGFRDI